MDFVLSSREFDLIFSALAICSAINMQYDNEDLSFEYDELRGRLKALYFQIQDDTPINVLYPKAYEKLRCGDNSSRH